MFSTHFPASRTTLRYLLPLLLSLMAGGASAQPVETVVVSASALAGVWKITRPNYVAKRGFFSALEWGPMRPTYCRFEQTGGDLTGRCLPGGAVWTTTIADGHIHLAFGTMMARFIIDGTLQSATHFIGTNTIKLSGIGFDAPTPSEGDKLTVSETTSDKGGKVALLRTILTSGMPNVPHDDAAIKKMNPNLSAVPQMGQVRAIAYLGPMAKPQRPDQPETDLDFFSVYAVEFDSGERICGLHQRADGVLDAFLCL